MTSASLLKSLLSLLASSGSSIGSNSTRSRGSKVMLGKTLLPPAMWVQRKLSTAKASDPKFWPPYIGNDKKTADDGEYLDYDWEKPTNVVYWDQNDVGAEDTMSKSSSPSPQNSATKLKFAPTFAEARRKLDYSYHNNLIENRQLLQDAILNRVVVDSDSDNKKDKDRGSGQTTKQEEDTQTEGGLSTGRQLPWLVFTAGPMGVGKGYVLTQLSRAGVFPLKSFIKIDPDMLKSELPEMAGYLQADKSTAATKLHRESTQMSDVLFEHALRRGLPILIDGSLRDVDWYKQLFHRIREEYPTYRIGILHVTADPDVIRKRAVERAKYSNGRVVPKELIEESIEQVPKSVEELSQYADAVHVIANNDDQPLELLLSKAGSRLTDASGQDTTCSEGQVEKEEMGSWTAFAKSWKQTEQSDEQKSVPCGTADAASAASASGDNPLLLLRQSCDLSKLWVDEEAQTAAKNFWGAAYPNFCPRCCLACDCQCGICIHGRHSCACPVCKK